jgi:hypothetical protein
MASRFDAGSFSYRSLTCFGFEISCSTIMVHKIEQLRCCLYVVAQVQGPGVNRFVSRPARDRVTSTRRRVVRARWVREIHGSKNDLRRARNGLLHFCQRSGVHRNGTRIDSVCTEFVLSTRGRGRGQFYVRRGSLADEPSLRLEAVQYRVRIVQPADYESRALSPPVSCRSDLFGRACFSCPLRRHDVSAEEMQRRLIASA